MSMFRALVPVVLSCGLSVSALAETHPLPNVQAYQPCEFLKVGTCNGAGFHVGVDFFTQVGTPVRAICDGTVKYDTTNRPIRNAFLVVEHVCSGKTVFGYYGHIQSTIGQTKTVKEGQTLGTVRSWTGDPANTHLHMGMARSLYSGNWGYRNSADDFFDFRTLLNKVQAPTKPNAPTLVQEGQNGSKVGFIWRAVSGGTNYRIQVARAGTSWTPENGFVTQIVNSTKYEIRGTSVAHLWEGAMPGQYQYSVRVNVDGVGTSDFARPKSFTVK